MACEASDVHLINNGSRSRAAQRGITLPIVGIRIDDHALHRRPSVVAFAARRRSAIAFGNYNTAPVGIEQNLGGIKSHPLCRIGWPIDAIAI
jgi:hypothetical protein